MKKKLQRKNLFIFLIVLLNLLFMNIGYSRLSSEEELEPVLCTLSEEYKEWEKLSEEEKEKTIMPPMCDSEKDNLPYQSFSFDVKGSLPSSYDVRTQSFAPTLKNQQSTGGCWAFSATTALETYSKKKLKLSTVYSTRHIEYSSTREFLNSAINDHGYNREIGSGGNNYMTSSYLVNGYGPISEIEMPFENNENKIDISEIQNKNILLDVNNVVLKYSNQGSKCTQSEIEDIKNYVLEDGAVMINTYITLSSSYYNPTTAAFYYNGTAPINHAVTIIGWDDNYSKTNFPSNNQPTSNGAWIVQNSYGSAFGENGYYYISYEDVHVCDFYMVIDEADTEVEDNSYIYDKLGYISFMGYNSTSGEGYTHAYAMNVFTKESGKTETLKEITFGTNGTGTYKIYYKTGNAGNSTISTMTEIGSGSIDYPGYITHKLDSPILLDENVTDFSIAIYYDMETSTKPVPVSVASTTKYKYVTIEEGQSYISLNGTSWLDLSTRSYATIASIKAFTNDVDYSLTLNSATVTNNTNNVLLQLSTTSRNIDKNNLKLVIKNSSGEVIIPTNIAYINENNTLKNINITLSSSIKNDTYTVYVYYQNDYIGSISQQITTEVITSSTYTIDQTNLLIYVSPTTTITSFKSNISGSSNTIYKDESITTSGYVTTGMTIDNYSIIVRGDVTGDGYVKMNDVMKICNYIVEGTGMNETIYQKAADVTRDSSIKMNDVMKIAKYIVEGGTL